LTAISTATTTSKARPVARVSVLHASWVTGATLGGLLGTALPLDSLHGLDFALSALFIVLAIDAHRAHPDLRTAALAPACALGAMLLLPGQVLLAAYAAFTLLLLLRCGLGRRGGRSAAGGSAGAEVARA
jgi:predicted branched-subunit amino acid permease